MLDIALKYVDELKRLYINTWHNEKYKYYNYRSYWELPNFEQKGTYDGHDFVSLNAKGEIIGAIGYCIIRDTESVCGLGIINFTDDATFGKDVIQAIKDVFEKYNFRKLSCCVVIGNPIEKTYDRLIPKYGGRIVGIEKQETKLCDNKYYDVKRYEILREDYMNARKQTKRQLCNHGEDNIKMGYWEQGDIYDCGDVCSVCEYDSGLEPCYLSHCPSCHSKMITR